jgi:biopolymer transport protein ExbD
MAGRLDEGGDEGDGDELADINITPFIDVMLVLLIIFMVAAPLSTVDVPVALPASSAPAQPRPEQPVFLTIDAQGRWSVGEVSVPPEGLIAAIDAATKGQRDTRLFLRADRAVAYGEVMALTERLRVAGYLKLALVAMDSRP